MNNKTLGMATYSPEDNKLRFYPDARLSTEDYARAKDAGFKWAPAQKLFVAPMWTPSREDLLIEWCGEIGDEDKSLVERSEERAERFEDYSDKRKADADNARAAVESICEHIPLGQPILVGHHSERRARKDAERIENGMRKAVKMWETSQYWQQRAKSAISHAKYKERPDVRARRIKTLEAEKRKQERNKAEAERALKFWRGGFILTNKETGEKKPFEITEANRERICKFLGGADYEVGRFNVVQKPGGASWEGWSPWDVLRPDGERYAACPSCTVEQCREAAERAFPPLVEHYNRWIAHYENRLAYEQAMLQADGGTATDKTGPEKGGAVKCWASVRGCWSYIQKVNKVSVTVLDNWGNGGGNFTRTIPFDKCFAIMTAAQVEEARRAGRLVETSCKTGFGLCGDDTAKKATETPDQRHDRQHTEAVAGKQETTDKADFDAMKQSLKAGVQVVGAPQLFPTPPAIAADMVEAAQIESGHRILEPSAGTGNLLRALADGIEDDNLASVVAVELNLRLAESLRAGFPNTDVRSGDFLQQNGELGTFDRIVMNPPFENGADIKHILHARHMLNPGGKLVALCANGPRQQEQLLPLADQWTDLPQGSFSEQGTNVNVAMLVING